MMDMGMGEDGSIMTEPCGACGGSGQMSEPCGAYGGGGQMSHTCTDCNGSGVILKP